jgi:hypothetical protein
METMVYNDNERQHYTPRPDYKKTDDGLIRKEQLPVDTRTGKMASVCLTIQNVEMRINTYINPIDKKTSQKKQWVLHFKEKYFYIFKNGNTEEKEVWSLPLALNTTNAKHILSKTGKLDMKQNIGFVIEIFYDETVKIGKDVSGGIRIANITLPNVVKITNEQYTELQNLCKSAGKSELDISNAYKVKSLNDLSVEKFEGVKTRLVQIATEKMNQQKVNEEKEGN